MELSSSQKHKRFFQCALIKRGDENENREMRLKTVKGGNGGF